MKAALRGAVAAIATICSGASAWESQLLPLNSITGKYEAQPVSYAGRNWTLLDYSYAGYGLGTTSLASGIPCNSVSITGTGDITTELQNAVNSVGSAGGGTVIIPAGRFSVGRSIEIPYSKVSIAGAGSGLTFLAIPSTYDPLMDDGEGVFTFGKALGAWNKAWVDRGNTLAEVSQVVQEGADHVDVLDASSVSVGAWVMVTQYHWPAFSQRNSGGAWPSYAGFPAATSADREASFAYLRQVTAKTGTRLQLDAPIPWTLDPANNPIKLRDAQNPSWIRAKTNAGVAGLSIEFEDNHSAADGRPAGAGVYFEGVRDGWVYDVQVRNFPRYGLYLDTAARITVLDSAFYQAQDYSGDGYGYGVNVKSSQNILVRRARAEDTRHGFTSRGSLTSLLVITQSVSALARLNDDTHYGMSQGVLWDAHRLNYGSGLHGIYRGTLSAGAHETVGSDVYWNVQGDGARGGWYGGSLQLNPSSDGWGVAVGPTGLDVFDAGATLGTGDRINAVAGLQTGSAIESAGPGSRDRNALYEGVGQGGLAPSSLHETQRGNRLTRPTADFSTACGAAPVKGAFTPALYSGSGVLVFDSDHLGYTPNYGSGCTGCDVDSGAQNLTAGGRESFAIQMSSTNYAIGGSFRGLTRNTGDFASVRLAVYPTQAGLQFRLRLSQESLPEGSNSSRGDYTVSGLTANQWNTITVPMTAYAAGSFNSVALRSLGSASTSAFYMDDVVLQPASGGTGIASVSPSTLAYGNQLINTTSAAQSVTVTNTGSASLTVSGVTLTGTHPGDYSIASNSCTAPVAAGQSCSVGVKFAPTTTGSRTASLQIASDASNGTQSVPLAGEGIAPLATPSPGSLNFGDQAVNTYVNGMLVMASTSSPRTVTVSNTGTSVLHVSSVWISGPNANDFFIQSNTCGSAAVPSGGSCSMSLTFSPNYTGARSATLSIASDALNGTQSVGLSGVGTGYCVTQLGAVSCVPH